MSAYDVERFESRPDPDLICCICHCVLDKPLESPCQHVFCKVCIETWLRNHHSCPSCRKRLRESKLKPALPIIKNMISRLILKCENSDKGCKTKVPLEQYSLHTDSCDFVQIKCMNTGCVKEVIRKDMYCHEKECSYRLVACKRGCGLPVAAKDASSHKCVEDLKNRLQKLEDNFENYKRDSEMRLMQLENMVADLQNRAAQQDSSASDIDQEDDNSRDSPDDEDANDPESDDIDDDDFQSEGGGGGDSGEEDEDDNGSNNEEEEDVDFDESGSSIEYASDASSYRDYPYHGEYDVDENSDGESNDSVSVEEINPSTPSPPLPHTTYILSPPARPAASMTPLVTCVTARPSGVLTQSLHPSVKTYIHPSSTQVHTPLPPPPPFRPTASTVVPTLNVVSVSTNPAGTSQGGVVGLVTSRPSSVVPVSRHPGLKMQLSLQVISRSQVPSTVTSAPVRPTLLTVTKSSVVAVPTTSVMRVSSPLAANPASSTATTYTQSTSLVNRSVPVSLRLGTNVAAHRAPTVTLPRGTIPADARAALRPYAVGSGSVIASVIPGSRRRRHYSRQYPSSSSSRSGSRTHPSLHRSTTVSTSSSSSLSLSTSYQSATSQASRETPPSRPLEPTHLPYSRSISSNIQLGVGRSAQLTVTTSSSRCRCTISTTGNTASRAVRAPAPSSAATETVASGNIVASSAVAAVGLPTRVKRRHNDDPGSSDEGEQAQSAKRVARNFVCRRKFQNVTKMSKLFNIITISGITMRYALKINKPDR